MATTKEALLAKIGEREAKALGKRQIKLLNSMVAAEDFSLLSFSIEVQQRARELLGIGEEEDFATALAKKTKGLPADKRQNLFIVLSSEGYRVLEASMTEQDAAMLSKAIAAKRVSEETDNWIATLLGQMTFDEVDHAYDPDYD